MALALPMFAFHFLPQILLSVCSLISVGLVLLICCVYLLVNAVTKGYYRGAFRTLAIVAVAGGLCVLLVVS